MVVALKLTPLVGIPPNPPVIASVVQVSSLPPATEQCEGIGATAPNAPTHNACRCRRELQLAGFGNSSTPVLPSTHQGRATSFFTPPSSSDGGDQGGDPSCMETEQGGAAAAAGSLSECFHFTPRKSRFSNGISNFLHLHTQRHGRYRRS